MKSQTIENYKLYVLIEQTFNETGMRSFHKLNLTYQLRLSEQFGSLLVSQVYNDVVKDL